MPKLIVMGDIMVMGDVFEPVRKLYEKVRANPHQVRFEELRTLLVRAGFEERNPGTSHYTYKKGRKIITVPRRQPLRARRLRTVWNAVRRTGGTRCSGTFPVLHPAGPGWPHPEKHLKSASR